MKHLPGFTDFFMSPVTGRIILPAMPDIYQDYVWVGDRNDRPLPSPILIDLRLEILDLRRRLSQTRFILQAASDNFDSSQALNELINGILKHEQGVVSIAIPGSDYLEPILPYQNVWIGNVDNKPEAFPRIQVGNLPTMLSTDPTLLLGAYNLYSGSPNPLSLGEPEIVKTLHITNMANLTVGKLWLGAVSVDPLNLGLNRPVEITVLPIDNMANLEFGKIWRGDISNRPVPSTALTDIETEIEDINTQLGDINTRLGNIDTNISSIFDSITTITDAISSINTLISGISDLITAIQGSITTIQGSITTINGRLDSLESRVTATETSISEILSEITTIHDLIAANTTAIAEAAAA